MLTKAQLIKITRMTTQSFFLLDAPILLCDHWVTCLSRAHHNFQNHCRFHHHRHHHLRLNPKGFSRALWSRQWLTSMSVCIWQWACKCGAGKRRIKYREHMFVFGTSYDVVASLLLCRSQARTWHLTFWFVLTICLKQHMFFKRIR